MADSARSTPSRPSAHQRLLVGVDDVRVQAASLLDENGRGDKGQFFTPSVVATFMASMFDDLPERVRLLDAGAGVGSLTAAFVDECLMRPQRPREISVVAYEIEEALLKPLGDTLARCQAACESLDVTFTSEIVTRDFVEAGVEGIEPSLFRSVSSPTFNCAILNPPYRKIQTDSATRRTLRRVGVETSNLYTAFVAVAIRLLAPGGQLVAITPRSFCNGPYFRPFREILLAETALKKIHLFDSRTKAFRDDAVLQENVIFELVKGAKAGKVTVSTSPGPVEEITRRSLPYAKVVRPGDPERFIRLTVSEQDERATSVMASLPATLEDLGLQVSTGRVVDFRARAYLRERPSENSAPLIYPCHFANGHVRWPNEKARKPNALVACEVTESLFVPPGVYVLTKRFTSKEERRRVVAAIYDSERVSPRAVGFENHLNYFHRRGEGLPADLAKGLWLFLNSSVVDRFFRQFSGHTQVNATDLRTLRYPSRKQLVSLAKCVDGVLPEQGEIDSIVGRVLSGP